jgi:AcrR family transcriptional regulator
MTQRASRTYPKGDRRRAQLLAVALEAFSAQGYRNASMLQIAATCGVSRAGLLHHFPTKELLLEAVLDERDRIADERFYEGAADGQLDGVEFLSRLIAVIQHNTSQPGIVSLYAVLSSEATDPTHPAHDHFVARNVRSRLRVRRALDDLEARGLLRDGVDSTGLEVDIVALLDGLQVQWLLQPELIDMPGRLRAFLRSITGVEFPAVPELLVTR